MSEQDGGPAADITLLTSCRELVRLNELLDAYRELAEAQHSYLMYQHMEVGDPRVGADDEDLCIARVREARAKVEELEAGR